MLDPDTWVFQGSSLAARLAAGACIEAVSYVLGGSDRSALCLVRPPGHHARPAAGMGFCIYANVALAAAEAIAHFDLNRILIADFDVHHGNGTAGDILRLRSRRLPPLDSSLSVLPRNGRAGDESGNRVRRTRLHVEHPRVPYGTVTNGVPRGVFVRPRNNLADRLRPELVLISAGFDAHAEDPVGDLGLEVEDFEVLTQELVSVAKTHARGRIVSVLEGGYNTPILAGSVAAHLAALGAEAGKG